MEIYSIREYSQFPVRSHCQGNFWFCFPWQCDRTLWLLMSMGIFPNTVKLHNSEWVKTTVNKWLTFFLPINHTGVELAHLKRRSIVDSPHRPTFKSKWPRAYEIVLCNKNHAYKIFLLIFNDLFCIDITLLPYIKLSSFLNFLPSYFL